MKQRLLFEGEMSDQTIENVFPALVSKAIEADEDGNVECRDCPHWQDGDDGPQCEYPDCPPCNGK